MSADIYFQLLSAAGGLGYFAGVIWSMWGDNGPFAYDGFIERLAASLISSGVAGAMLFALIYSMIWVAVRSVYFGFTGI